jgi:DNA-binding MarR family transcriptional regulator
MTLVNENPGFPPQHVAYLLHLATRRMRQEAELEVPAPFSGLSAAQTRLLDLVPAAGTTATELSARMRVTKQGLGQLVAQLTSAGYLQLVTDPADRRAKVIRCTELGEQAQELMRARLDEVERRWRAEVGTARYRAFREVLAELVAGHAGPAPGP